MTTRKLFLCGGLGVVIQKIPVFAASLFFVMTATAPLRAADGGFHAAEFLWGTEGQVGEGEDFKDSARLSPLVRNTVAAISGALGVRYVKFRIWAVNDRPPPFDMDEVVRVFRSNGWSMIPMFSRDPMDADVTVAEMDEYADFIVSFLDKYKSSARIRLIEQQNAPQDWWQDTPAKLLQMNNRVYEQVKAKHPDVRVGTPGFEYSAFDYYGNAVNDAVADKAIGQIEYFLDKANGAKFDFWAFHGYPIHQAFPARGFHPPTRAAGGNRYAGIPGILEVRKKLDANGWQDRLMIDAEHVPLPQGTFLSDDEDAMDAAYIAQDLIIRRSLESAGKPALAGITPLKLIARGEGGERAWGSLRSDGSLSGTVKAFGVLLSKLKGCRHDSRVSGRFGDDGAVWIEKFRAGNKELYVFFKPFMDFPDSPLRLDNKTLSYSLVLREAPRSATLTDIQGAATSLAPAKTMTLSARNAPQFLEVVYGSRANSGGSDASREPANTTRPLEEF